MDFSFDLADEICEELTGYKFENVLRLVDDFGRAAFALALETEGYRSTLERRFLIKQSDSNETA